MHDKVAGLVYVAALVPDAGESSGEQYEGFAATPDFVIDVGEDGFGFLDPDTFKKGFAADASDAEAAFMRDAQVPVNMSVFGADGHRRRPGDRSRAGPCSAPRTRRSTRPCSSHMAKRAGADITTVPGSHAVYLTQADAVTDVIVSAATATIGEGRRPRR